MATINYNGMELEEFTSDKPVAFAKGQRAAVWDDGDDDYQEFELIGFFPYLVNPVVTADYVGGGIRPGTEWLHCALLPEKPAPRRATNRELARWLVQGNGECTLERTAGMAECHWNYETGCEDEPANGFDSSNNELKVRKWSDTEWHVPTVDYLGIGEKG